MTCLKEGMIVDIEHDQRREERAAGERQFQGEKRPGGTRDELVSDGRGLQASCSVAV